MSESTALQKSFSEEDRLRLAVRLAVPSQWLPTIPPSLEETAAALEISTADLAALLTDTKFVKMVRTFTRAQANLTFHTKGIQALVDILGTGENKEKLVAIKLLGALTGDLRSGHNIDVRISFDELRKRAGGNSDDPLESLFEIKGQDIIDVEPEADSE